MVGCCRGNACVIYSRCDSEWHFFQRIALEHTCHVCLHMNNPSLLMSARYVTDNSPNCWTIYRLHCIQSRKDCLFIQYYKQNHIDAVWLTSPKPYICQQVFSKTFYIGVKIPTFSVKCEISWFFESVARKCTMLSIVLVIKRLFGSLWEMNHPLTEQIHGLFFCFAAWVWGHLSLTVLFLHCYLQPVSPRPTGNVPSIQRSLRITNSTGVRLSPPCSSTMIWIVIH